MLPLTYECSCTVTVSKDWRAWTKSRASSPEVMRSKLFTAVVVSVTSQERVSTGLETLEHDQDVGCHRYITSKLLKQHPKQQTTNLLTTVPLQRRKKMKKIEWESLMPRDKSKQTKQESKRTDQFFSFYSRSFRSIKIHHYLSQFKGTR